MNEGIEAFLSEQGINEKIFSLESGLDYMYENNFNYRRWLREEVNPKGSELSEEDELTIKNWGLDH